MLAPPEGLRAPGLPGVDPRSQGVIPRRFKRKKIFVTSDGHQTPDGWTDRRVGRNSDVDIFELFILHDGFYGHYLTFFANFGGDEE